ncbi:hypothetical protein GCM10025783_27950 [Amnibacterium soli]|uniref:O-antigen ligase domain-containing protein n=1 Tax=Amnibacterium soli TaxID=1282736 RepID=A0ABP8ZEF1_9MICO
MSDGALQTAHGRTVGPIVVGYAALWIIEGAFRKWVPGSSLLFYVARDGFAVLSIVWMAAGRRTAIRALPWWSAAVLLVAGGWLALQSIQPSAPPPLVLLFGLRSYLAPLLLLAICWLHGTRRELDRIALVLIAAAPLQLVLTVLQVLASPSAFINRQVGGAPNIFVNSGGVVRATGTFSAPSGLTIYLLVALAVALSWTLTPGRRAAGWTAVTCALATTALSGARGAVLNAALLLAVYLLQQTLSGLPGSVRRVAGLAALLMIALAVIQIALPEVLTSFVTRFDQASESEDSSSRLFDQVTLYLGELPTMLGDGMGARSNAGIALGSTAGWIENDSLRWVAELGAVGYLLSLLRTAAAALLTVLTFARLRSAPSESTLFRAALATLLLLSSVNGTPTNEGAFAVLLSLLVLSVTDRDSPAPRITVRSTEGALR